MYAKFERTATEATADPSVQLQWISTRACAPSARTLRFWAITKRMYSSVGGHSSNGRASVLAAVDGLSAPLVCQWREGCQWILKRLLCTYSLFCTYSLLCTYCLLCFPCCSTYGLLLYRDQALHQAGSQAADPHVALEVQSTWWVLRAASGCSGRRRALTIHISSPVSQEGLQSSCDTLPHTH